MKRFIFVLWIATCSSALWAMGAEGLDKGSRFSGLRPTDTPVWEFALWNQMVSVPGLMSAWESLLDDQQLQTAAGNQSTQVWVSEHLLSAQLHSWHRWSFSVALPVYVQQVWGDAVDDAAVGIGDVALAARFVHAIYPDQFWLAGVQAGITLPTAAGDMPLVRRWDLVESTPPYEPMSEVSSDHMDLWLGMLSTIDFSKVRTLPVLIDLSWRYLLTSVINEDRKSYGERVEWSASAEWLLDSTWSIKSGFWGDRNLSNWYLERSSTVFLLGLRYQKNAWELQCAGEWGFFNTPQSVSVPARNGQPAWQADIRTVGDFALSLGIVYRIPWSTSQQTPKTEKNHEKQ